VLAVIAGPSGVGKGTIIQRLRERDPRWWVSVSATTRPRRPAEVDGREYYFLDDAEFSSREAEGAFLESFDVYGAKYGTPRDPIERHLAAGDDILLEIDVQGARAVRAAYPDAVLVFVRPPSRAEQRTRLLARDPAADRAALERRLDEAEAEEAEAADFDAVVVNDDLSRAVDEVAAILKARRKRV
jgi:guanylate kinase